MATPAHERSDASFWARTMGHRQFSVPAAVMRRRRVLRALFAAAILLATVAGDCEVPPGITVNEFPTVFDTCPHAPQGAGVLNGNVDGLGGDDYLIQKKQLKNGDLELWCLDRGGGNWMFGVIWRPHGEAARFIANCRFLPAVNIGHYIETAGNLDVVFWENYEVGVNKLMYSHVYSARTDLHARDRFEGNTVAINPNTGQITQLVKGTFAAREKLGHPPQDLAVCP